MKRILELETKFYIHYYDGKIKEITIGKESKKDQESRRNPKRSS